MLVRKATIEDLGEILTLCKTMHEESSYSKIEPDKEKTHLFIEQEINNGDSHFLVLLNEEIIVGIFLGKVVSYFFSNDLQAMDYLLYIKKENRGTIGALKLLKSYIQWAKEQGVKEIVLSSTTGVNLDRTEGIYRKLGFHKVGVMYKFSN